MRTRWWGAIALIAVTAGCSSGPAAGPPEGSSTRESLPPGVTASQPTTLPTPRTTPVAPGTLEYHDGQPVEPPSNPSWDDVGREAAVDAAVRAVELFARPDEPYEQWWAELAPLMSTQAQVDYQYVDPLNVPARAVTGDGVLIDETSASIAGVEVPTDIGSYTVVLSRTDDGAPWLVERISPPQSED